MDWLKKHLGNLVHAAADLVEKHPDVVVDGLRFVAGAIVKAAPAASTIVGIVEQVAEAEVKPNP